MSLVCVAQRVTTPLVARPFGRVSTGANSRVSTAPRLARSNLIGDRPCKAVTLTRAARAVAEQGEEMYEEDVDYSGNLCMFLDSASEEEWAKWLPSGIFTGVTTNPIILERDNRECTVEVLTALAKQALEYDAVQVRRDGAFPNPDAPFTGPTRRPPRSLKGSALLVTLTGVLAAVANISQLDCLLPLVDRITHNTTLHPRATLGTDLFLFQKNRSSRCKPGG
jgi:hypothetical protein